MKTLIAHAYRVYRFRSNAYAPLATLLVLLCATTPLSAQGFNSPPLNPAANNFAPPPLNNNPGGLQPVPRVASNPNQATNNNSVFRPQTPVVNNPQNTFQNTTPSTTSAAETDPNSPTIANRNLLQMFHDGGWMMYPIALCSFVLTVFIFERLVMLRPGRVIPRPFVRRLIEQLQQQQIDREEALELCERNPSLFATILVAAVKRYGRSAVEVEQAVVDAGERVAGHLRKHLRILNSISNVAPLLGLLGTVLGMIEAFNAISNADPSARSTLLAGGIGHAMLTTAGGLMVAIPAYLAYMYFLGRTDKLLIEMDRHAQQVVEAISAEGLAENDTSRSRGRSKRAA